MVVTVITSQNQQALIHYAVYPAAILLPDHVISVEERNGGKRAAELRFIAVDRLAGGKGVACHVTRTRTTRVVIRADVVKHVYWLNGASSRLTGRRSRLSHVAASDVISHVRGLQRRKLTPMFISLTGNSDMQCCFSSTELELKLFTL